MQPQLFALTLTDSNGCSYSFTRTIGIYDNREAAEHVALALHEDALCNRGDHRGEYLPGAEDLDNFEVTPVTVNQRWE